MNRLGQQYIERIREFALTPAGKRSDCVRQGIPSEAASFLLRLVQKVIWQGASTPTRPSDKKNKICPNRTNASRLHEAL
jgi:hypothetical protein